MYLLNSKSRLIIPGTPAPRTLLPSKELWDVLENLVGASAQCERPTELKTLALQAVRDATAADAVFWYPGISGDAFEIVGAELPADWCQVFTRKLLDETPGLDGQLLRSHAPLASPGWPCQPQSAALVRVSKSLSVWIVALSLSARRSFHITDMRIMALIRQILVTQRQRVDLSSRMVDTLSCLVQCLTNAIDTHLPHARGHSERVAKIAVQIGKRMSLPGAVLSDLHFAGLLHDVGITSVHQSVLLKPGKLTEDELAQVRASPLIGDKILAGIKQFAHLRPAVRHHRERPDGQGYPDRLVGDAIPLMARIVAVADAYDAMCSPRPHRPALAEEAVGAVLAEGAGRQWDPCVIEHFLACRPKIRAMYESSLATPRPASVPPSVWNSESSQRMAVSGGTARAAPSLELQEVALL